MKMRKLKALPERKATRVRAVFTDIDDTLTHQGLLEAPAFDAMWKLHRAGIAVVPVTGRPAGWCDHIARTWPVAGIVGENGAFYYRYLPEKRALIRRFVQSEATRLRNQKKLHRLRAQILKAVPGAGIASDQAFRLHDLAVDYCEDVTPLGPEEVERIVEIFERAGATAKVSSIHVNGWFGRYNKLHMIKRFAKDALGLDLSAEADNDRAVYVGDSPNDEPAFAFFRLGVGVANVKAFTDQMTHLPSYVSSRAGGRGFAQLARHLLAHRRS